MPDFQQQIVFQGIDNVSKTVAGIMGEIGTLDTVTKSLDQRFAAVSRTGAVFASKLKAVAFAVAGVTTAAFWLAYRTSDAAESLLNLSEKTGVSVEGLQKLNYIADQANVGAENLAMGFKFLNKAIADASTDTSGEAAAAFRGLNVDLRDMNGNVKSTEAIFYDLSDAFQAGADGPNKVSAATKLLGKAGERLIPVLNRGSDALRKQGANFTKFGNQIDKGGLQAIAEFNDTVDNLMLTFKGLGSVVAQALIPVLQPLTSGFAEWVAGNRELIRMKVSEWVQGVQVAFNNFLPKLERAWNLFTKFWATIGGFEGVLKGLAAFMAADLLIAFANFAGAVAMLTKVFAISSPIGKYLAILGLIAGAVTALNAAFPELGKTMSGVVDKMVDMLGGFFDWFWKKIQGVLKALHLVNQETNKTATPNPGKLTTVVNPETGKATTSYNPTGLPSQTDYQKIPAGQQSTAGVNPGGPLDGLWNMLSGKGSKPMEINLKLDTSNEVSYVDIDAPLNANVTVNSGPMISY